MSLLDARRAELGPELSAGVCIVGAGAAGISLSSELESSGTDVLLVESGGFQPDEATQSLYDLSSIGHPVRDHFMSRARYFGGSCNLWAGRSMKLSPLDLEGREWVRGSAWPLPYSELEAYYPRAARILDLPSLDRFDPGTWEGSMGLEERRLFAEGPLRPTVSLWARKPMRFGATYRTRFQRSRRIRVLLHASVTRIRLNSDGSAVERLEARTLSGRALTLRARAFVLACGGLENPRLLLVSRDRHARGIGNGHDLVGRYFMDHPRAVFGRVRLDDGCRLPLLRSRPLADGKVQIGIGSSVEMQRREGLLNHYATLESEVSDYAAAGYETFVRTMKVLLRRGYAGSRLDVGRARLGRVPGLVYLLTPKELVPHSLYRLYAALRSRLHPRPAGRSRIVVYFCEQPPDPESRVTLDTRTDRLGVNRLVLRWRLGPEVTRGVLRLQEVLRDRLRAAGIGELTASPPDETPQYSDASHHMGTTRMGATPRDGVVDVDGRVHGVGNLYVAGSSTFPSAGHANPTLTIVALALRLADRLRASAV